MKTKLFTIIIAFFLMVSCKKDFLELAPVSAANVQNFYKDADDMERAVTGAYNALQLAGQYGDMYILAELRSDNTRHIAGDGDTEREIDIFSENASSPYSNRCWQHSYVGIAACNTILARIGSIQMDQTLKDQLTGEARFLRALMYFNLVRIFGKVPLVLTETKSTEEGYQQGRNEITEVYAQIIADLGDAGQKLPASYTGIKIGRATKGAAKALLGKVHLTLGKFSLAAASLKEVIDLNVYTLLPVYADIFKPSNANNKESIFEVQYKAGGFGLGSSWTSRFLPRGELPIILGIAGAGVDRNTPTPTMANSYEVKNNVIADRRYYASMDTGYVNKAGKFVKVNYIKKYLYPQPDFQNSDVNWPVLRYADVLLMYAEALNEVGNGPTAEAYSYINQVRARAGLGPLSGLDYNGFKLAMEHERQVELAFENHRWFDLLRTGRALTVMNAHFAALNRSDIVVKEYQLLYPVPQNQIDVNPDMISQNPGY